MQDGKFKRFSVTLDKDDHQLLTEMANNAPAGVSLSLLVGCAVKEFITKHKGNKLGIRINVVEEDEKAR